MSEAARDENLNDKWPISGIPEAALIKPNNDWKPSPVSLKLLKYANDLYESGAKLWTKEMFISIEKEMSKDPLPSHVQIRQMNGEFSQYKVPSGIGSVDDQNMLKYAQIDFMTYQDVLTHCYNFYAGPGPDAYCEHDAERDYNELKGPYTLGLHIAWCHEKQIPSNEYEYSRLKAAWEETWQIWIQSTVCNELIALLKNSIKIPGAMNKLVCFGLGNVDSVLDIMETPIPTWRRRSITQHAAALTMATTFGQLLGTGPLPIHVQDPAYTPLTQHLLRELGFEVVGGCGSLAFTLVDDDTIVFTCAPNIPVKQIVADIARPVVTIWDSVKPNDESKRWTLEEDDGEEMLVSPWTTDEDSPRTRKLVEGYDIFEFPDDPELFGELEIYIRRD